jgi:UDP-glucose 4-epimerase
MKILITGTNSYIGNSVKDYLNKNKPNYLIDLVSLKNVNLKLLSFKSYDVVVHVAAINHSLFNKPFSKLYKINTELAIEVAKKAKSEFVKHFIFTSSLSLYGNGRISKEPTAIDTDKFAPSNGYGYSKLLADIAIQLLGDEKFNVTILRIPMVYGPNAKGNLNRLISFSRFSFLFPKIQNFRSIINILNLSELFLFVIQNKILGVLYPQDSNYFSTNKFLLEIRKVNKKFTFFFPFSYFLIKFLGIFIPILNKFYGYHFILSNKSIIKGINYQIYSINDFIYQLYKK